MDPPTEQKMLQNIFAGGSGKHAVSPVVKSGVSFSTEIRGQASPRACPDHMTSLGSHWSNFKLPHMTLNQLVM